MRISVNRFFTIVLVVIWFAIILLFVYGNGIGLHYRISPLLILLSLLILFINSGKQVYESGIIKILGCFIFLAFITSYHYYLTTVYRVSYLQYLSYSISGYIVALTSYSIVKNDKKMINVIYCLFIVFFIIGIFRFFRASNQIGEFYANNAYYYIVTPLPILLMISKRKIFNMLVLSISTILCVLSLKRGALISIGIVWLVYIVCMYRFSRKNIIYIFLFVILGCFLLLENNQTQNIYDKSKLLEERFLSIEEDGGSGRTGLIENFFERDLYDLMSFPEILIGRGFEGIYNKYKNLTSLHNDFLEVLYSYGFIGLALLFKFYYKLLKKVKCKIKNKSLISIPYTSMVLLFLLFSFVGSNFNYFCLSLPLFISLGILEGCNPYKI